MQLTTNRTVDLIASQLIRALCFIIGLTAVIAALNFAVIQRVGAFEQRVDLPLVPAREVQKNLACLASNIYWEAANEPFEGKVAVAQVTVNRVNSDEFPDTVCGVVHQKTSYTTKTVCQFSWLCETNYKTKPIHPEAFKESEEVAKMVMLEGFRLKGLEKALYYHADYVNPKWNKDKVTKIGRHIFYKNKGA